MENNKKFFIICLCVALVAFSLPVYAEEETTEEGDLLQDVCFTMYDVISGLDYLMNGDGSIDNPRLYDACRSLVEMSGNVVESGQIAADVLDSCIDKSLLSVASSFMATGTDMISDSIDLMRQSDELMRSIWFYPSRHLFQWNSETVKKGVEAVRPLFVEKVYNNVPPGFYPCTWEAPLRYASWKPNDWYWFSTDYESYYTHIGGGRMVICSFFSDDYTVRVSIRGKYGSRPTSASDGFDEQSFDMNKPCGVTNYKYVISYYFQQAPVEWLPAVVYDNESDACLAFYSFQPTHTEVSNGKGYFRPLPEGKKMTATAKNVFNTDFNLYITNNYNTYGDTFTNVPVDTYPYTKPDPETPPWWYNIYRDPVEIPNDDNYTDLTGLELGTPATNDTSFLSACFSVIPERLSVMFISLSVLWAVCCLFKKGD